MLEYLYIAKIESVLIELANLSKEKPDLSILLPMYNEAKRIENCIREVEKAAKSFSSSYEIIVAEDGSTDGTDIIAQHLVENNPRIKHLHSPVRLGKGRAIKNALRVAKGDIIVFLDADLATNLEYLPQVVATAKHNRGMAIGSRLIRESKVRRSILRTFFSLVYNTFVRMLFLDSIHDHQCGFKAISRELAMVLMKKVKSNGFCIDTEMIVQAKKIGFPVAEIGVEWTEWRQKGESKVRLFRDALKMGMEMLSLRLNINRKV